MKLAITGSRGFIGLHLLNTLLYKVRIENLDIIRIERDDFNDQQKLKNKLKDCKIIIHLAGVNRHEDENFLYDENVRLTNSIVESVSNKTDLIIFASSIQQDLNNPFGKSKLRCFQLFSHWAKVQNFKFINLKIPNIFGPFGKPNYNSFVSTFCSNLVHGKKSKVVKGKSLELLYIDYLNDLICNILREPSKYLTNNNTIEIEYFKGLESTSVESVFNILRTQWYLYEDNIIPDISSSFEKNLFNTLRSFIPPTHSYSKKLEKYIDNRGFFSEIIKTNSGCQFSISTTYPGITRGNHFHTRKIERFIIIQGKALIEIRRVDSNKKVSYYLEGTDLKFIDIPIWYTHKITNVGNEPLITLFWINEPYNQEDSDTYFLEV